MLESKAKKLWSKFLHYLLDGLMFVVPVLEITEVMAVIPPEYLPWYMLVTVMLRRLVRLLEEYSDAKLD